MYHPNLHGGSGQDGQDGEQPTVRLRTCIWPGCHAIIWRDALTPYCEECRNAHFDECTKLLALRDKVRDGTVKDFFGIDHITGMTKAPVLTFWPQVFKNVVLDYCWRTGWRPWEQRDWTGDAA